MSHVALRRVAIRLLHDPAFAGALYADPDRALAGVELTTAERAALVATPAAAWRTDAGRPARVLAGLLDEFPGSAALAPDHGGAFFASPHFHGAVQDRGSLALALGAHFGDHPDPRVASVARLETEIARVRRAPRRVVPSAPGALRLSPRASLARVATGSSVLLDALRRGDRGPRLGHGEELILVLRAAAGDAVTLERAPPALAGLLEAARTETSHDALVARARELGADPAGAPGVVDGLVAEALLV